MSLIIISGPSGSGQDSIIEGLQTRLPIERVITTTTRPPRPGEEQGKPYYFISREAFERGIAESAFFEWAEEYNGQLYGVTLDEIQRVQASDKIGIWKIEYKGVATAKKLLPDIIAILITAPLDVLAARIRMRDNASDAFVAERMAYTKEWLEHRDLYDYEVVNEEGKLEEAIQTVVNIIQKETIKTA